VTNKYRIFTLNIANFVLMAIVGKDILFAVNLLKEGKLVAIPTETVYGLAANALDTTAVARIYEAKNRPFFDPLILHVYSMEKAKEYVNDFPETLQKLAKAFWPGPLTLLLPKKNNVPDLVTAGSDKVAVRVPRHPLTLQLLKELNFPLAAPSANPFGYISPTGPAHVNKQLGNNIDYILDGGSCRVGLESTIVGMQNNKIYVYRLGGLSIEEIENVVEKKVELKINKSGNPLAPGQLKTHYAPVKPLLIGNLETLAEKNKNKKLGILGFGKAPETLKNEMIINLSEENNLTEAAANFFASLRKLDESDVDVIICSYLPKTGLGLAMNDRLERAAAR
jgi:L-threonylcarbamoyladenylate synthase